MVSKQLTIREIAEENTRTYVEDVCDGQQFDLLIDLMAAECPVVGSDVVVTPEMHGDYLERMHAAFPDLEWTMENFWFDDEAEMAFFRVTMRGTFENELVVKTEDGEMLTFDPTGESFSVEALNFGHHDAEGRVDEIGGYMEELSLFTELGIVPELEEFAA